MIVRSASLALALTTALPFAAAAPGAPEPVPVRPVATASASGGALVPASVVAVRRATLSTRVAASVTAIAVREGDRVREGDLLVSLSDGDVRGALAAAEAALAAAASHERRIRELAAQRAATASELELATAQRAQAEAAVAGARATLGYTQIRAPFSGTVQARRAEPGDLVGPGQPIVELEGDALELVASLAEAEARGIAVGAVLRFDAGSARGEAVVRALAPGGDPLSHRRAVRAQVREVEGELRSGAFARLHVPGASAAAGDTWLPRTALVARGDLTGVFVAREGRAELRWISVGEDAGELVAVRAGLRAGEIVIDAPGALRDGQAVEVRP
jgi:membrane fusion protein (multidrug efflux system)